MRTGEETEELPFKTPGESYNWSRQTVRDSYALNVVKRAGDSIVEADKFNICKLIDDANETLMNRKEEAERQGPLLIPKVDRVALIEHDGKTTLRIYPHDELTSQWVSQLVNKPGGTYATQSWRDMSKWWKGNLYVPLAMANGPIDNWVGSFRRALQVHYHVRKVKIYRVRYMEKDSKMVGHCVGIMAPKGEWSKFATSTQPSGTYRVWHSSGAYLLKQLGECLPPRSAWTPDTTDVEMEDPDSIPKTD